MEGTLHIFELKKKIKRNLLVL